MNNKNDYHLDILHMHLRKILDDFAKLCDELDLQYFLANGTLLGAARHKNIIPWDDDIDVAMPRNDYNKLITFFKESGKENYKLYCAQLEESCDIFFAKLVHIDSSEEFLRKYFSHRDGLTIDIFPLDVSDVPTKIRERVRGYYIKYLRRVILSRLKCNIIFEEPAWKHIARKMFIVPLSGISIRKLVMSAISQQIKNNDKKMDYIVNFCSVYNSIKETNPLEYWLCPKKLPIGDHEYPVPGQYEKILEKLYGKKWYELPPEYMRYQHDNIEL